MTRLGRTFRVAALAALALGVAASAQAQPNAVKKTTLQHAAFPGRGLNTVLVRTAIAHGGLVAPHTHPGLEMAYIEEGEAEVAVAGAPVRQIGKGESFQAPPGAAHSVRNIGPGELVIVSTYVVDPAKPIASPVR